MFDRLFQVFTAVQERYLHDPAFATAEARRRHVEWLRTRKKLFEHELRDECDESYLSQAADNLVIEREIIATLPPRVVHEVHNNWAYLAAEVTDPLDPSTVQHDELSTLHWYDRTEQATVDTPAPVGDPADYRGFDPIEEVALPPQMHWTDADKKVALDEAVRIYGIEPGQWFDLEWPPVAHLWDPSHVYQSAFEPCEAHVEDDGDDDCAGCQDSVRDAVEDMAQWKWTTTLRIHEISYDGEGQEFSTPTYVEQGYEVAATQQDPRQILIGPPGQGRYW
ncbi:hypothetical protein [Mycolicibacterium sp.]|uniref:hypothetical protein n=1 Tax=Mycolicibacterium sp. TaxID=2320850 RepID=UPI001152C4E8|nr:hypothetical protein [Mycobacterium sp. DSM 3803]